MSITDVERAFGELTVTEQEEFREMIAPVGPPGDKTRDVLWIIVVGAFAFVLLGTFITLASGVFVKAAGSVSPELILAMFTSVVGFLAGLFSPSPLSPKGASENT